jgi:hypothetical protein
LEPSIQATIGVLIVGTLAGGLAAALWATLNGIFLLPVALFPGARDPHLASGPSKQIAVWTGVIIELFSNTGFAILLCWACTKWVDQSAVYMWVMWIAVWLVANAPLRWNLRDATTAREKGNHHLLHSSIALAYLPVKFTTAGAIAFWIIRTT